MSEAPVTAPALGASLTMNFGGDRQMVLQTHFPQDMPAKELNTALDKIFVIADRQKARYEIVDFKKEIEGHQKQLRQWQDDFEVVENTHKKKQAERDIEIAEFNARAEGIRDEGYGEHAKAGKKGSYEPVGHRATNISRLKTAAVQMEEAKKVDNAERDNALHNLQVNIDRYLKAIEALKAQIVEREAIVGK